MAIRDRSAGPVPPIVRNVLQPGAFVTCTQPGHFSDPSTGMIVPGPRAVIEPLTRAVVELMDFPEPAQLPHFRMTLDERSGEWIEVAFNHVDSLNSQDCLQLALDTGILRKFPMKSCASHSRKPGHVVVIALCSIHARRTDRLRPCSTCSTKASRKPAKPQRTRTTKQRVQRSERAAETALPT